MSRFSTLPRLIRRRSASVLLMYVLVSFGASVLVTRLFLDLARYPQLGGNGLHIAHLLWGGLALMAAALMMLIFASPSVNRIGAILTGLGIGLFMDEVGKFITSDNNYFFQAAAPIIYVTFLLVALVYYILRRRQDSLSERELLCAALEDAESLLEVNPYEHQRADLAAIIERIKTEASDPDYIALARAIQTFSDSESVRPGKGWWGRAVQRYEAPLQAYFERHHNFFARLLLTIVTIRALASFLAVTASAVLLIMAPELVENLKRLLGTFGPYILAPLDVSGDIPSVVLNAMTSGVMIIGVILFALRKPIRGLYWMQTSLVLSLCVVNIFAFYQQQFVVAIYALTDLAIFIYIRVYLFRREKLVGVSNRVPSPPPI
ncbi:MAG: hypothetical protein ABIQ99_14190 [Thermoflexales bacterium]